MLDIELFRTNLEKIIESEKKRFKNPSNVEKVLHYDIKWREILSKIQDLRKKRNAISAKIGEYKKKGESKKPKKLLKLQKILERK